MGRAGGTSNGGLVARRAVVRWALRLFRREWRQQLLILGLVAVAVTGAVAGSSVAYGRASSRDWYFGDANHLIRVTADDPEAIESRIESAADWFGTIEPIRHYGVQLPGWDGIFDLRAQALDGAYSTPTLDVLDGRYPSGQGEIALTDEAARFLGVEVGGRVELDGETWELVGLAENPGDFEDEFAVVSPEHAAPATDVEILVDASDDDVREWPRGDDSGLRETFGQRGSFDRNAAAGLLLITEAMVLLLVALVAAAGFVVVAQRRQRQIGLLAATGATDKHLRLVMLANGVVVGTVAAVTGTILGLAIWFAAEPSVEQSAGHRVGRLDLPWLVIVGGGLLGIVATAAAAWWPARTVARLPVTAALSGRPPDPKPARRTALPGALLLAAGAGSIVWANPHWYLGQPEGIPARDVALMAGGIAIGLGVLLICPLAVRLVATGARRLPVAPRLAVRDLARYRTRSSAALAAISLALGIPIAMVLIAETSDKQGDEGNLSAGQLVLSIFDTGTPLVDPEAQSDLDETQARIDELAATLDDPTVVPLEKPWDPEVPPEPGFEDQRWSVNLGVPIDDGYQDIATYVATREILDYYGIDAADIPPGTEVLTDHVGELTFVGFQDNGDKRFTATHIEPLEVPEYSSAPRTFITEETVREHGWDTATAAWFVESSSPLTTEQVAAARGTAADLGLEVQVRRDYSNSDMRLISIVGGMAVALAIVAMTVGLVRSEAADDLRTLTATGASSRIRRSLTAATAGALGLLGVLVGGFGAYVGLVAGYLREPSYLGRVPVVELLVIGLGMPLLATAAGWLLGGREPRSLLRPRMPLSSVVVLFALVVAVGACGGSDDDGGGGGASGGGGSGGGGERVDAADRDSLPLQVWEDAIVGTGDERLAQERRVEQRVADCMAGQGFEYVPVQPHPGMLPDATSAGPWSLPEGEFAERYGYGLFTMDSADASDPNVAIVAAMSESERDAYAKALNGPGESDEAVSGPAEGGEASGGEPAPPGEEEAPEVEGAGNCYDGAWQAEFVSDVLTSEDFASFNDELDALFERQESDPRIEDATGEWAACMADQDPAYDVEVPDDAVQSVMDRYFEELPEGGSDDVGLESWDVEGQNRRVHRVRGVDLTKLDPELLRKLREYELAVATADYDCRADYDQVRYEVARDYEEEFIADHLEELERLRDAIAANAG